MEQGILCLQTCMFSHISSKYFYSIYCLCAGVWTVGNIGREQGGLKAPLLAAYVTYFTRYYIYDETVWFTLMVLAAALAFDSFSKEWRKKTTRHHFAK